jgi:hypothetical protein
MRRRGMTLAAVVVAVFLGLILLGVLLMALSKFHDARRRVQTNNNLKECALAVHGFHDSYKRFPDAFDSHRDQPKNVSLWTHLLPFVDKDNVYRSGVVDAVIPAYLAPADPSLGDPAGALSFAANLRVFASGSLLAAGQPVNEPGKAVEVPAGQLKSGMTFGRFPDGTTNTIMLSTRYANCAGQRTWYAADALGNCEVGQLPSPGVGGFMGAGSSLKPASQEGDLSMTFQMVPTKDGCLPQAGIFGHSFGQGGMSVALCDGSVRNIRNDMRPLTFARALSPADGQPFDCNEEEPRGTDSKQGD